MKSPFCIVAGVYLTVLSFTAFADLTRPVKFTLPAPVTVGSVTLPAGECTVDTIGTTASATTLVIRCSDGKVATAAAAPILRPDGKAADKSEVLLHQTGSKLALHRVWVEGDWYGFELLNQ